MRLEFSQWNLLTDDTTTLTIVSNEKSPNNYDIKFIFINEEYYTMFLSFVKNFVDENNIVELNPILIIMNVSSITFKNIKEFVLKEKNEGLGFKYKNSDVIFYFKSLNESNKKTYHAFIDIISRFNYEYEENEVKEEVIVKSFPITKKYPVQTTKISYYMHQPYYPSGNTERKINAPMSKRTASKTGESSSFEDLFPKKLF